MLVDVRPKTANREIEVYMQLSVYKKGPKDKNFAIGFQIYDINGTKVQNRHTKVLCENERGYLVSQRVSFDGNLKGTGKNPLTLIMTTFDAEVEAKFRFTIYYKHT